MTDTDWELQHAANLGAIKRSVWKSNEAAQKAIDAEFTPRMIGNAAFNIMIRSLPLEDHCEAPYKYDTIWWDHAKLNEALAVHYCNDDGKRKREFLESVWVSP